MIHQNRGSQLFSFYDVVAKGLKLVSIGSVCLVAGEPRKQCELYAAWVIFAWRGY